MSDPAFDPHLPFLEGLSTSAELADDRFVPRNFRLDEVLSPVRATAYVTEVLPARDFPEWAQRHAQYVEDHLVCIGGPTGPPTSLDPDDPKTCPETFGPNAVTSGMDTTDVHLSLVRVVGIYRVAQSLGINEDAAGAALEDPALRDGIVERWAAKLPVEPVFATFWQDVRGLVPKAGTPPPDWADDLRDRLGLSFLDPEEWGPIGIMVLRYEIADLPTMGTHLGRSLAIPTELDGLFFAPFCPTPVGVGLGRVIDLGQTLTSPWLEVLHPTLRWRGSHVAQVGVIRRSVPPLAPARGRHLRLLQTALARPGYGTATDGDLL